jgi:hypothetical protein
MLLEWFWIFAWPIVFLIIVALCVITVEVFSLVTKNLDRMDRSNDDQVGRAAAFIKVENAAIAVTDQPGADKYRAGEVLDSLNEFKLARQDRVGELGNTVALPLILLLVVTGFLNLAAIGMFPGGTSHWVKQTFGLIVAIAVAAMLTSVVVLESAPFIHQGLAATLESFSSELNSH